jgi:phosphoglycolate phosphatase
MPAVASLLLFDIDLTLIRSNGAGRMAMDAAFTDHFGAIEATRGIPVGGRTDRAIFLEVISRLAPGHADAASLLPAVTETYLTYLPAALKERGGETLPGVRELLAVLPQTHSGLGIATGNLRRGAEAKLAHFGLLHWFMAGGFGDAHTHRGEVVRDGIAALAGKLNCPPVASDCIVLGDTPLDVEAAHAAGARCLAVATGSFTIEALAAAGADWAVANLSETARIHALLCS